MRIETCRCRRVLSQVNQTNKAFEMQNARNAGLRGCLEVKRIYAARPAVNSGVAGEAGEPWSLHSMLWDDIPMVCIATVCLETATIALSYISQLAGIADQWFVITSLL
jgi:hypothetical protein